ncbi:MAG: hypothetical protein FWD14_08510 [Treponema sp.]|nr:hypothetical protein [Treponema sp.]
MEKKSFKESVNSLIGCDSKVCSFFRFMKNKMGIGSPEKNAADTYERGMRIVPDCIKANDNEVPVKQYNIAVLRTLFKFERAEGRLQITNKRIILRAAGRSVGGRTTLQHEFAINEVAGIEARNNFKFSFLFLVFALFIINFTSLVINGRTPAMPNFLSLLPASEETFQESFLESTLQSFIFNDGTRISSIMRPSHVDKAYNTEKEAIHLRDHGPTELIALSTALTNAKTAETRAERDVELGGVMRTRRVQTGSDWWTGQPTFSNQSFRDTSEAGLIAAQTALDEAIKARENAEEAEQHLKDKLETAGDDAAIAIKNREFTVKFWAVLMTIAGILLGLGSLAAFLLIYKRFGLKLFILNFGFFGWSLAYAASYIGVFNILKAITVLAMVISVFLFCFRPNLIINIKNKVGTNSSFDIRRDIMFTKNNEKGTGFAEVIPTAETENAIREIGAIIRDIQQNGDSALEKWSK